MGATVLTGALATGDLSLLAYARQMMDSARSPDARHMFEEYVEKESRRLASLAAEENGAGDKSFLRKKRSAERRDGGQAAANALEPGSGA